MIAGMETATQAGDWNIHIADTEAESSLSLVILWDGPGIQRETSFG
jgi:hypothetical protein